MSRAYLVIPITVGIIAGLFLAFHSESKNEPKLLTESNLIGNGSPVLGNPNAPITILEWGDYQCTFCYRFHQNTLDAINKDFIQAGKVKLVFKDFPLNGPDSLLAAEASYCAEDQGRYWQYHDELYENWGGERTGWITRSTLAEFAQNVNLDTEEFNSCLDEKKHQNKVVAIHEYGKEIGIDATPSFLVFNDEKIIKIRGNQPLEVFLKAIDGL